jgi:hypothetical protein
MEHERSAPEGSKHALTSVVNACLMVGGMTDEALGGH